MRFKIPLIILGAIIIIFLMNPLIVSISTKVHEKEYAKKYPSINISMLEEGDIIFGRSMNAWDFIPGYWTHAAMFYGYINKTPFVIQATHGDGVNLQPLMEFAEERKHIMVGKPGDVNSSVKKSALDWAQSKLGMPFDQFYPDKQLDGASYYCTELIWAGYMKQGVDLDMNSGFTLGWANGVAPQEVFDNPEIELFNLEI